STASSRTATRVVRPLAHVERPSGSRLSSNLPSRGITRLSTPHLTWENAMPLPTIANCWRVSVNQELGSIPFCNVIHIGQASSKAADDIAEAVGNAWVDTGSIRSMQTKKVNYSG